MGPSANFIADDTATNLQPGQLRKSEFFDQLQAAACAETEGALAGTEHSATGCPYLAFFFGYYRRQGSEDLERTLRRFVPEARGARSASDYIPFIATRVRQGVERWVRTGEVTGVPEGAPRLAAARAAAAGTQPAAPATVQLKARDGAGRKSDDPEAVEAALDAGRPLDSGVRSRMEGAFGRNFSGVRLHTDAAASRLSSEQNARAFTVGRHVAFGQGQYRPGTLIGDALIAHELAHVMQQCSAVPVPLARSSNGATDASLEADADRSALSVAAALWGTGRDALGDVARRGAPRLRSGLRLQRCQSGQQQQSTPRATVAVRSSGNRSSTNDKSFPSGFAGDKLGALTDEDDGITIAETTGKVEIVATLPPESGNSGWDIKRELTTRDYSNGTLSRSVSGQDDTSDAAFKDLTPDPSRRIFDIDGPTLGISFTVDHTKERYSNFTQWVTLNGSRASDDVEWHYHARVDDDLDVASRPSNDDTELNDVGVGHLAIPGSAHYPTR